MNVLKLIVATIALASFSQVVLAQELPADWVPSGETPTEYRMERAASARYKGEFGAAITHESGSGQGFGTLRQAIRAETYRGKRVTLKGWIKTQDADSAQMWLRIDAADRTLSMDNMDDRPVKGTTEWKEYEIVMDVPVSANHLVFGFFLSGKGAMAFDEVTLEVAPGSAQPTKFYDVSKEPLDESFSPLIRVNDSPVNMNLEQ